MQQDFFILIKFEKSRYKNTPSVTDGVFYDSVLRNELDDRIRTIVIPSVRRTAFIHSLPLRYRTLENHFGKIRVKPKRTGIQCFKRRRKRNRFEIRTIHERPRTDIRYAARNYHACDIVTVGECRCSNLRNRLSVVSCGNHDITGSRTATFHAIRYAVFV